MRSRVKMRKSAPALDAALAFENVGARTLPPVLTAAAVAKGLMPPLGVSALPPSLEGAIPPELRYWTAKSDAEAKAVRDELVERAVIRPADVLKVDGALRRVVWQAFLAEEDAAPAASLAKRTDLALAGAMRLAPIAEPIHAFALGELESSVHKDESPWTAERITKTVEALGQRVCLALSDTPEHRAAIAGLTSAFALETRPGVVYGSPLPLDPEATHVVPIVVKAVASPAIGARVYVDPARAHMPEASGPGTLVEIGGPALGIRFDQDPEEVHHWYVADELSPMPADASSTSPTMAKRKAHTVKLLRKADAAEPAPEERFVFGVVLEPDVIDSQNDTYDAGEVRKAAHRFMEEHAQLGQQHSAIVTGKLKILESYVAPVDFAVGTETVKAGTWMLAIRVVDDGLWTAVKAGSFTGFSIGGTAIRQPDPTVTPA